MVFFVGLVIDLVMGGCNGVFCYKELQQPEMLNMNLLLIIVQYA